MAKTTEVLEFLINANVAGVVSSFEKVGDAADKNLTKAQTRSDQVSANLTKFGAGAVAVAGIVGAGLVKLGSDFDNAFDKIRVGTGATGEQLKGLQGDFKAALSQVPNSMDEVSTAITTLNQKLGLSGEPLQKLSVQFLNLSTITGTDLTKNIDAATGAFNNFGIDAAHQGAELDTLFKVTQASGISFEALTTALSASGAQFRAVGIDFDHAAGLIGLLAKNGLSAGDVIPALGKAMATAAKDGKPAQQLFQETFDAIKNAPTDTIAAGDAMQVFGAKAGPKLAALIREGKLSFDEFLGSVNASGDTINAAAADTFDFGEKLGILRNKLEVAIEPAVSSAFDNLTTVVGLLGDAFDALPEPVVAALGNVLLFGTAAIGTAGAISLLVAKVGPLIGQMANVAGGIAGAAGAVTKFGSAAATASPAIVNFGAALVTLAITNPEIGALIALGAAVAYVGLTSDSSGTKVEEFNNDVKKLGGLDKYADFLKGFGDANNYAGSAADKAAGITANAAAIHQRFLDILKESPEAAVQYKQAAEDAGISTAGWSTDIDAAALSAAKSSIATDTWTGSVNKAKDALTGTTTATVASTQSDKDYADAVKFTNDALAEKTKALTAATTALQNQQTAALATLNSDLAYNQAVLGVSTALDDYQGKAADATKATKEHGAASDEATAAQKALDSSSLSLQGSILQVASAAAQSAKDQAAAAGTTLTMNQSIAAQVGALEELKKKFPELSSGIDAYIAKLKGIPTSINTTLVLTQQHGEVVIGFDANGNRVTRAFASGGMVPGGTVLVGEQGPELVALPKGAFVYTAAQSKTIMGMAGGGWMPPNSVNPVQYGLDTDLLHPVDYLSYYGTKTGTVPFTLAPAGGSQYNTSYYQDYGAASTAASYHPPLASVAPGGGYGNVNINQLTINMPVGSNGDDIVQALKRYERRNGGVPISTFS